MKWQSISAYTDKLNLKQDQAQIWYFDLDQIVDKINLFTSIMSPDELKRADKFHFEIDKNRYVCARGILRTLIFCQSGIKPSFIKYHLTQYGKPELEKDLNKSSLKFNLSHSKNCLCIGITYDIEIGVDIEFIDPIPELTDLAKTYLSPKEYEHIIKLPEQHRYRDFYLLWTKKEAITKALGQGLSIPLRDIEISQINGDNPMNIEVVDRASGHSHSLFLETFEIDKHFMGAAAFTDKAEEILYLKVNQYEDLISKFGTSPYD